MNRIMPYRDAKKRAEAQKRYRQRKKQELLNFLEEFYKFVSTVISVAQINGAPETGLKNMIEFAEKLKATIILEKAKVEGEKK